MFWKIVVGLGAVTFVLGGLDILSSDCPSVDFGGRARSATYTCLAEGGEMSGTAAGSLMIGGGMALLGLVLLPSLLRRRQGSTMSYQPIQSWTPQQPPAQEPAINPERIRAWISQTWEEEQSTPEGRARSAERGRQWLESADSDVDEPQIVQSAPTDRTCPWCAESIKAAAIICRFCDRDVVPSVS